MNGSPKDHIKMRSLKLSQREFDALAEIALKAGIFGRGASTGSGSVNGLIRALAIASLKSEVFAAILIAIAKEFSERD